jgi:succinate dehydrogenase/fumarate reductase flavoprotein subunit
MEIELKQCDVLCVGGGITGLMAAICAGELAAKVIIAEKGNSLRSGSGRAGNDHFWCYIPEVHGPDIDLFIKECKLTQLGGFLSPFGNKLVRTWVEKSFDMVKFWDGWGIPMKYNGNWEFAGHSFPGRMLTHLKYSGRDQTKILTNQALSRGVLIMNRVAIIELLGDRNGVTGAIGIDTRDDRLIEFQAKSVILGTGCTNRMYPNATPNFIGNSCRPFTLTGDGRAMAYRLGAELFNVEMLRNQVGPKNYERSGKQTWIGVFRDPQGNPIGKYVTKPDRIYGDILSEVDKQIFGRMAQSGTGPAYMDCTGCSDEDYEYMLHWMRHEGYTSFIEHLNEEGIDLRKHPIEFTTYPVMQSGGEIRVNERAETSIKGLYSGGDDSVGTISGAAVFGWIAGENAARYAKTMPFSNLDTDQGKIEEKINLIKSLQNRMQGSDWKDANSALQHTMSDYAGQLRSESMLKAGLSHLRRLKQKTLDTLRAANRWELTRCLEVLNLFDLSELVFIAAMERTESRGSHRRVDYPLTDPMLNNKILIIKKANEHPFTEWRNVES